MNYLRLSAASIILFGFSAAGADSPEAIVPANAPPAESELEPGWASEVSGRSAIRAQANASLPDAARGEAGSDDAEIVPERIEIANLDLEPTEIRTGNGSEGCMLMAIPGSRIHEWRCYYPSEGEKALNEYQFKEEIRYMVDQVEQLELIQQQAKAMMQAYGEMYRRR